MHTKIVFQRLDRFWDYIYNNNAHKNIRRRDTMKLKHVRTLAAGVITAALLVLTGVAGGADTVQAAGPGMAVTAVISGTEVSVKASGTSVPASDDGMLYLFAEPVYSDAITTSALASSPAAANAVFTTPLNANSADSRLYSKFIVAAVRGGQYVPLNTGAYIVNPEAIANRTFGRTQAGKKGLIIDPAKLNNGELRDLGVKQTALTLPLSRFIGPTENPTYPTVNYSYNGRNYQFNGLVVAEYDNLFGTLTRNGIQITAQVLNPNDGRAPQLIHPLAKDGFQCQYYTFNTAEKDGADYLAAAMAFIAERYSDGQHGRVDNWIIGNEVNKRHEWNYVAISDLNAYVNEYAEGFRICYNAIKSRNANAKVYICMDQQWDRNRPEAGKYDSKDFIDSFNAIVSAGGNIDWALTSHQYPVPLTWAAYWTGDAYYKNLVKHNVSTAYMTMENIEVMTDYMCSPQLLAPDGQVRSILLTEVGYTTTQGDDYACAAMVLGYQQAANNQHIDGMIMAGQTDHPVEIAQGLALGLNNVDGSHKGTYDCFKQLDGPNASSYIQRALALRGVSDLGQVVYPR